LKGRRKGERRESRPRREAILRHRSAQLRKRRREIHLILDNISNGR